MPAAGELGGRPGGAGVQWAASEELVPAAVFEVLRTVAGLRAGRTAARGPGPVLQVPVAAVLATLPHLNRHLAGLVRLSLLTGMRPGEACRFRIADVDADGGVWPYTPPRHKARHRGKASRIKLGPQAQVVIVLSLGGDPTLPLFSPLQARAERCAALRASRKTRVQPSQTDRSRAAPKKLPGLAYTVGAYSQAVGMAAKRAGVPHWHPNQLRHAFATAVRKAHGLEAAQVLGRALQGRRNPGLRRIRRRAGRAGGGGGGVEQRSPRGRHDSRDIALPSAGRRAGAASEGDL